MALTKEKKTEVVKNLVDKFNTAKSVVFTDYQGLTVTEIQELREEMRKEGSEYIVAKNTLIKKALDDSNLKDLKIARMSGPVGVAFGLEDEVAPARIVYGFAKKHEALEIRDGVLESEVVDGAKITALAQLPSRDGLLAQVVGSIKAPVSGFVSVLSGNLRGLVCALNAIKESKE